MGRKLLVLFFLLLWSTSCSLLQSDRSESIATQTPTLPAPIETPTVLMTPQPTEQSISPPVEELNIWVIRDLSPQSDVLGGTILAEQLAAYENNHPDVQLNIEVKVPSGQGGTLSYLRSGRNVAPSILPDLIILPAELLPTAVAENLIFPLDQYIKLEDAEDLFPAANTLSKVNNQVYGFPIALSNLSHMAYSSSVFTDTVPITWEQLLSAENITFAFPGAGNPGAELILQLYLAFGGSLIGESSQPTLEVEPLSNALSYFNRGRNDGLLPIQNSSMTSFSESWLLFNNGAANSVQTIVDQYGLERDTALDSKFSELPGVDEPLVPLVKGWVWTISTPDPMRQARSAELLNWLAAGPNMGDWSFAAQKLPGRRSAFEQWPVDDEYINFIQQELERAAPYPEAANSALLDALSTAVFDVLTLAKTPQQAAEEAVTALKTQ